MPDSSLLFPAGARLPDFQTGRFYPGGSDFTVASTSVAMVADRVYFTPFWVAPLRRGTAISISTFRTLNGTNIRAALYTQSGNTLTRIGGDPGSLAIAAVNTFTISAALDGGASGMVLLVASTFDATPTMTCDTGSATTGKLLHAISGARTNAGPTDIANGFLGTRAFGALPATLVLGTDVTSMTAATSVPRITIGF